MQVILSKRYNPAKKEYKGYPIFTSNMRENAEAWGGKDKIEITIPDRINGFEIFDIEDRMNNKIYKIKKSFDYEGTPYEVSFDLYTDALFEVIKDGKINKGIIESYITFIDKGKLVLVDGQMHKTYLEKEANKNKKLTNFVVGNVYTRKPDDEWEKFVYLGKFNDKHVFLNFHGDFIGEYDNARPCGSLFVAKSVTMRRDLGPFGYDMKQIKTAIKNHIDFLQFMVENSNYNNRDKEQLAIHKEYIKYL